MSSVPETKPYPDHDDQRIAFQDPFAAADNGSSRQDIQLNSHLNVPLTRQSTARRSSVESLFSDLSELNIMSNEYATRPLMRTASNASQHSAYSSSAPRTLRQRLRDLYYDNYGALLVLLSQVFGSAMNVSATLLEKDGAHGKGMHPFQILFVRQSLTALCCTVWALTSKSIPDFPLGPPDRKIRLLLISRGLFGFFGVFGMYFSLIYLPLSEATVLTFLAPILTCYVCSKLLSGETFTRQQFMAGLVSLVGVIFIAQPVNFFTTSASDASSVAPVIIDAGAGTLPNNTTSVSTPTQTTNHPTPSQHLFAIAIAMLGVLGATGAMTSIRAIGTRAHAFISINYFSVWSSIVSLIAILIIPGVSFRLPSNLVEWALLFNLGICGFVLQALLTMGLAYGGPGSSSRDNTKPASHTSGKPLSKTPNPDMEVIAEGHHDNDIEMQIQTHVLTKSDLQAQAQPPPPAAQFLRRRSSTSQSQPTSSSLPSSSHITTTKPNTPTSTSASPTPTPTPTPASARAIPTKPHQPRHRPSGNKATSMVYCQMLFALAADRLIFGTTLGVSSWIGSGLILCGAVWVAAAREGGGGGGRAAGKSTSAGVSAATSASMVVEGEMDPSGVVGGLAEVGRVEERVGLLGHDGQDEETRL